MSEQIIDEEFNQTEFGPMSKPVPEGSVLADDRKPDVRVEFKTKIWFIDGSRDCITSVAAPSHTQLNTLQFVLKDRLCVVNASLVRKFEVEQLRELEPRIIT